MQLQLLNSWIREAYEAVQLSLSVFEGLGDIRQSHYNQAVIALNKVQSYIQILLKLLNTAPHLPILLDREQMIIELRRIDIQIKQSISQIANYDTLKPQKQDKNRKDTHERLLFALMALDKVNQNLHEG